MSFMFSMRKSLMVFLENWARSVFLRTGLGQVKSSDRYFVGVCDSFLANYWACRLFFEEVVLFSRSHARVIPGMFERMAFFLAFGG